MKDEDIFFEDRMPTPEILEEEEEEDILFGGHPPVETEEFESSSEEYEPEEESEGSLLLPIMGLSLVVFCEALLFVYSLAHVTEKTFSRDL